MAFPTLSFKNSVSVSVLLHVGVFALCVAIGARSETVPLPVGVELMYGSENAAPSVIKQKATEAITAPQAVATADDEGIAVDDKKKPEEAKPETQVAANTATLGNPNGTSTTGALTGQGGVVNGREVSPEERYLYEVRKLLERNKRYPVMARKMGHTGRVMVSFTLDEDGALVKSEVVEKAPFESLNEAAHNLVKTLHGAKPFPEELHKKSVSVTLPIDYSLN